MSDTQKRYRVFFDTSALLSGLNSSLGGAGVILGLSKIGDIQLIISEEVIQETERNIAKKFPLLKIPYLAFLTGKPFTTKKVTTRELQAAYKFIPTEDAPIAAGALKARANIIVTLDQRFQQMARTHMLPISVLTPGEFLQLYRK